jgi:hypothetical protein
MNERRNTTMSTEEQDLNGTPPCGCAIGTLTLPEEPEQTDKPAVCAPKILAQPEEQDLNGTPPCGCAIGTLTLPEEPDKKGQPAASSSNNQTRKE